MSEDRFLFFMSCVQYRQKINPDGSLGTPEIIKKWVSEQGGGGPKERHKIKKQTKSVNTTLQAATEL